MIQRCRTAWLALLIAGAFLPDADGASDRQTQTDPALQALERFVGKWDIEIVVPPGPLVREGMKARGVSTNVWAENGRGLRQVWSVESSDRKPLFNGRTEITYDPQRRVFRNHTTLTQGPPGESEGRWDERSGTFTWTARDPKTKITTVSKTTPVRDGVEKWTMVMTDGGGRVVFQCGGTNTRRRE